MKAKQFDIDALRKRKTLTKTEAAQYIGIGIVTFTKLMKNPEFYPLVRIGFGRGRVFINREKLDQWLNEQDGSYKPIR